MEWQAVVLVIQILLLAVGWLLFQQARSELTARAAETPVLGEVKALQRSVKQLLTELEETSDQISARLESRCAEARELLLALYHRLEATHEAEARLTPPKRGAAARRAQAVASAQTKKEERTFAQGIAVTTGNYNDSGEDAAAPDPWEARRQAVYARADEGESPAAIAHATGLSEGEVETLLSLRLQRR